MRPHDPLDEPPPVRRRAVSRPVQPRAGVFADWRRRFGRPTRPWFERTRPGGLRTVALALAAIAALGVQAWTVTGLSHVRDALAVTTRDLDEAHGSLARLWDVTAQLDRQQLVRLGELGDSIRSVFDYAQGGVRLWETAYQAQGQRVEENAAAIAGNAQAIENVRNAARASATRLDELTRAYGESVSRVAALERRTRTQEGVVEALIMRLETQRAELDDVANAIGSLQATLADLDSELAGVEDRLRTTGSAFGQMDTRIARLDDWIDGFRRAGLSGDAVQNRLAMLANELRRVTMRIDSLRSSAPTVLSSQMDR